MHELSVFILWQGFIFNRYFYFRSICHCFDSIHRFILLSVSLLQINKLFYQSRHHFHLIILLELLTLSFAIIDKKLQYFVVIEFLHSKNDTSYKSTEKLDSGISKDYFSELRYRSDFHLWFRRSSASEIQGRAPETFCS